VRLAPQYSKEFLDTAITNVCALRKEAKDYLVNWFEEKFDAIESLLDSLFDYAYKENITDLKALIGNIELPQGKKNFEEFLTNVISAPLANAPVQSDLESLEQTILAFQQKVSKLASGTNLNDEESLERELMFALCEFWSRLGN